MLNRDQMSALLRDYHNGVSENLGCTEEDSHAAHRYDVILDTVVDLLTALGYSPDHHDSLHTEIDGDLQTLLMLAALRSPRVEALFQRLEANPEFFEHLAEEEGWNRGF